VLKDMSEKRNEARLDDTGRKGPTRRAKEHYVYYIQESILGDDTVKCTPSLVDKSGWL